MVAIIRRWLAPPVFQDDAEGTRLAALLNSILWVFILAALLYGLLAPIESAFRLRRALIILPFLLAMLGVREVVRRGRVRLAATLVVALLWLMITVAMLYGADYHNPAFMGYLVVVICAGLLLNWKAAIGWSLFSIATSAALLLLGQAGRLPVTSTPTPPFAFWVAQSTYILTSAFLLSQTLRILDEALAKAQRELKERRRVEAERERIIQELENKNAELERFTYTVSHDLKSPLITIGGFLGLLEQDARSGNTAQFQKDLERIREAKDRMHRLLNELLELSRIGRILNPPSDIPFIQIVDEALALTRGRLLENKVQVQICQDLPTVHGDHPRLVEVLQNLVDNAAKFMGDQPEPRIEIGVRPEADRTVFYVSDNGIGIDPAYHARVFGLFDKLNATSEGTGVGLALVKRIVELHGGHIWVESEGLGRGSCFCFTLPSV